MQAEATIVLGVLWVLFKYSSFDHFARTATFDGFKERQSSVLATRLTPTLRAHCWNLYPFSLFHLVCCIRSQISGINVECSFAPCVG